MNSNVHAFAVSIAIALASAASSVSAQPVKVIRCNTTEECIQDLNDGVSAFDQISDTPRARENFNRLAGFINERPPQSADLVTDQDGTFSGSVTYTVGVGAGVTSQSLVFVGRGEEGEGAVRIVEVLESVEGGVPTVTFRNQFLYDQLLLSDVRIAGAGGGGNGGVRDPNACEFVDNAETCYSDPIVVDLGDRGYDLTGVEQGVQFDIDADGALEQVAWTVPGSDDALLALDRNGNRQIDDGSELFGNATMLADGTTGAHGYVALEELDLEANGGNDNGYVDYADRGFGTLLLWTDRDHDGRSSSAELLRLRERGIFAIALDADESDVIDEHGNQLAYVSPAYAWRRFRIDRIRTTDVFFLYRELTPPMPIEEPVVEEDYFIRNESDFELRVHATSVFGNTPIDLLADIVLPGGEVHVFHAVEGSGGHAMPSNFFGTFRVEAGDAVVYEGVRDQDWRREPAGLVLVIDAAESD
jgi:hypothetical protein